MGPNRAAEVKLRGPDQLKRRRKARTAGRPRDEDLAVLQGLPKRLERGPLELGELVEQEHAAMREARLARAEARSAADDRRGRRAVVRRAERRLGDQRMVGIDESRDRMDSRHFERRRST